MGILMSDSCGIIMIVSHCVMCSQLGVHLIFSNLFGEIVRQFRVRLLSEEGRIIG